MGTDNNNNRGHRKRLRTRFLKSEEESRSDEALLELLLTYAIPQKDIKPLARKLILEFGGLSGVLDAETERLCGVDGIKENSAVLIKLVDHIRGALKSSSSERESNKHQVNGSQPDLFVLDHVDTKSAAGGTRRGKEERIARSPKERLFAKALIKQAIEMLPRLPETESLEAVKAFLRKNLHFSAEQSRQRYTSYIVSRMFPNGDVDRALLTFAKEFEGRQELRDVCFYRFCKAEPLMYSVIQGLLLPGIGAGRIDRSRLRDYLGQLFPSAGSIGDGAQAIVEALVDSRVVKADRTKLSFGYRDILIPSFSFVLHSEFPEPGIYPIDKLESNSALRAMLWNPDRILSSLYELRNLGLIAKVSEIDSVRQFTTRYNLDQVTSRVAGEAVGA